MIEFIFITSLFAIAILAWATAIWVVLIRPVWRVLTGKKTEPLTATGSLPPIDPQAFNEFVRDFNLTEDSPKPLAFEDFIRDFELGSDDIAEIKNDKRCKAFLDNAIKEFNAEQVRLSNSDQPVYLAEGTRRYIFYMFRVFRELLHSASRGYDLSPRLQMRFTHEASISLAERLQAIYCRPQAPATSAQAPASTR